MAPAFGLAGVGRSIRACSSAISSGLCARVGGCLPGWPTVRAQGVADGCGHKKGCAAPGSLPPLRVRRGGRNRGRVSRRRGRGRRGWTRRGGRRGRRWSSIACVDDERVAVSAARRGESIGRMNVPQRRRAAAASPPGSASRSLRAMRSVPSALVRVTPSGSSTNAAAAARDELRRCRAAGRGRRARAGVRRRRSRRRGVGSWRPVSPTGCWRSGSVQPAP